MIAQDIFLHNADWNVEIYYDARPKDADAIISQLWVTGCPDRHLVKARRLIESGVPNEGLTYSNPHKRKSIMVIGHTGCVFQFFDTLSHEKQHLEQAICKADGLDPYGERIAYLSGDISQAIARNALKSMRKMFLYLI